MFNQMSGATPFEKAQIGIVKRMMLFSAISATKELMLVYKDIDNGIEYLKELGDEETLSVVKEALKDLNDADKELISLSSMLEKHMGISA